MANKHGSASNYMIQVKTVSGNAESGTQASYSDIRLIDAEENYFITADEIVRCLRSNYDYRDYQKRVRLAKLKLRNR